MFQNMQSIGNKIHLLEAIIQEKPELQVICISESWLDEKKKDLLKIENFTIGSYFCREQHKCGGVCILVKNTLEYFDRFDIGSFSLEMIFEICAIEVPKVNMLIINLYWPDSNREVEIFYSRLDILLNHISKRDSTKNISIGGDLNVDFHKNNNEKNRLLNLMLSYNFHQKINEPTRVTSSSSTCIDVLFVNYNIRDAKVSVQEFGLSDHRSLLLTIPFNIVNLKHFLLFKRVYNDLNISKFINVLCNINWNDVFNPNNNVNENYNLFNEILQNALNNCIPKTLIKIKTQSKKEYLTVGIKTSCRYKRFLKLLVCKTKNETVKTHYKLYCKILKKLLTYRKNIVTNANSNTHKIKVNRCGKS